jgi:hypothetical protein
VDIGKTGAAGGPKLAGAYAKGQEAERAESGAPASGESRQSAGAKGAAAAAQPEFSAAALERAERQEALSVVKTAYDKLPETRQEVLSAVREKLATGHYDSPAVLEALSSRLGTLIRRWEATVR